MTLPLESVPNFSEGREQATLDALADALGGPAKLLDVHADVDHNRSVFTLVGDETDLVEALLAAIARARDASTSGRTKGHTLASGPPMWSRWFRSRPTTCRAR